MRSCGVNGGTAKLKIGANPMSVLSMTHSLFAVFKDILRSVGIHLEFITAAAR